METTNDDMTVEPSMAVAYGIRSSVTILTIGAALEKSVIMSSIGSLLIRLPPVEDNIFLEGSVHICMAVQ